MYRFLSFLVLFFGLLTSHAVVAKTKTLEDIDLQDVLGPSCLAVPPSDHLQPLRVRQANTPLGVDGQPILSEDANKDLFVTIQVHKFNQAPMILTVIEGLVFADHLGQTYIPMPRRFEISQAYTELRLAVIPSSPRFLVPQTNMKVGFVGQYHETLNQVFRALDQLLYIDFKKVLNQLEQVNGHWKFKGKAPSRSLLQWLRWVEITAVAGQATSVALPTHFWRYLVWAILEDYNVQDFASWLRATGESSAEYAAVDALELTDGLKFFLRSQKLESDVLGPGTYAFLYNQGVRAFRASEYASAELFFREALRVDGTQHDAHFNLGLTLYRRRDYEGAAEAWLVATGLPDATADMFYHRGVALLRLESPLKAALMFRAALKKSRNHKEAAKWLRVADPNDQTKPARKKRRWRRR